MGKRLDYPTNAKHYATLGASYSSSSPLFESVSSLVCMSLEFVGAYEILLVDIPMLSRARLSLARGLCLPRHAFQEATGKMA